MIPRVAPVLAALLAAACATSRAPSSAADDARRDEERLLADGVRDPAAWDRLGSSAEDADADDVARRAFDRAESLQWPDARPRNVVRLTLPFAGRWKVVQGNRGEYSHASLASRFAWDFQLVDAAGASNPPGNEATSAFFGFGAPVVATADGVVERVLDEVPDNADGSRDHDRPAGNFVVLRHAGGEFSHFCHLMRGSVAVRVGQRVVRGATLGRCGCSGNAAEPHLHYVLRLGPTSDDLAVPARFDDVREGDGVPREGDFVEASSGG